LAVRSTFWRLIPVALPPGRLRLATRPSATGSPPTAKTIGMVAVAALAASVASVLTGVAMTATCRRLSIRPAEFDRHVLLFDMASFAQPFAECRHPFGVRLRRTEVQKSDHWHRRLLRSRSKRPCSRAAE